MKTILLVVSLATFFSACSDLGQNPGEVYVIADVQTIAVTNTTKQLIYVFVIGADATTRTEWLPICGLVRTISPESTFTVNSSSLKNDGERAAIIYWWTDCREVDGHSLGQDIHALRVALP